MVLESWATRGTNGKPPDWASWEMAEQPFHAPRWFRCPICLTLESGAESLGMYHNRDRLDFDKYIRKS